MHYALRMGPEGAPDSARLLPSGKSQQMMPSWILAHHSWHDYAPSGLARLACVPDRLEDVGAGGSMLVLVLGSVQARTRSRCRHRSGSGADRCGSRVPQTVHGLLETLRKMRSTSACELAGRPGTVPGVNRLRNTDSLAAGWACLRQRWLWAPDQIEPDKGICDIGRPRAAGVL